MPQDFSRELGGGVTPISPVQAPQQATSALATIANIGTSLFRAMGTPDQPSQPSWSERQAAWERDGIRRYADDLRITQQEFENGNITETEYASRQRMINANFYEAGYDLNSGQFQNVRETVTGLPDQNFGFTAAQDTIRRFQAEGNYGAIAYAQAEVQSRGMPLNDDSVAQILNEKAYNEAMIANINITDTASFVRNRDILIEGVRESARQQSFVLAQLDEQDIIVPAEVSIGSAQQALDTYQRFNDRIPANISSEERRVFDEEAEKLLAPWKALGLIDENNTLVPDSLTSNELDLQTRNKLRAYARVLSEEGGSLSDMLATFGITNAASSGQLWDDPRLVTVIPQIEERIANAGLSERVSEILPDIAELETRTIFGLNEMLMQRRRATSIQDEILQPVINSLSEEQRQVWQNSTPQQNLARFQNMVDTLGGVNLSGIESAPSTEGLLRTFAGLSLSMDTIDFSENAYSNQGLQAALGNVVPVLEAYKNANPREAAIAEQLMFTAIAESQSQYNLQIRNRESMLFEGGGFYWDSESNSYKVSGTEDPSSPNFGVIRSVIEYYDGNLSQAVRDNFERVPEIAPGASSRLAVRGTGVARASHRSALQRRFGGESLSDLEDLRRSEAFLANLGSDLEPAEFRAMIEERTSAAVAEMPSYSSAIDYSGGQVYVDTRMNPALEINTGVTHSMVQPWAVNNLRAIIDGPFRQIQDSFGSPLTISDALPKVGTQREDPNYEEGTGSQHFYGNAIDVDISNMSDEDRIRLLESALNAGARGIGLGRNFMHIDFRNTYTAWSYENTGDTWGGISVDQLDNMIENYGVAVPRYTRNFNARGAAAQLTTETDPELSEGSAPLAPLNLGGGVETPQQQPEQMGGSIEVTPLEPAATEQPQQEQPQPAQQPSQTPAVDADVEAVVSETTRPQRTYNSMEELDAAYQAGEVNAGEEVTVTTDEGEAVFVIDEGGNVRRVR